MTHQLPVLPYAVEALSPLISGETIEYHYGKHHRAYVDNLNKLIQGTEFETMKLEGIVKQASGGIYNNAAQVWNHTFYWHCLTPEGGGKADGELITAIVSSFGSFEDFRQQFTHAAVTLFGSGWAWLVKEADGKLAIEAASNAGNPLTAGKKPLLACDVWEHAYYIDYRNARPKYLEAFWQLVNWDFVSDNYR